MAVFWIKLYTDIKKLIFFDKKKIFLIKMNFFLTLKNCIEEFFLSIDIFFQELFFGSNHAKPENFEASIILENDSIVVKNQHQTEDDFEFLSANDSN